MIILCAFANVRIGGKRQGQCGTSFSRTEPDRSSLQTRKSRVGGAGAKDFGCVDVTVCSPFSGRKGLTCIGLAEAAK